MLAFASFLGAGSCQDLTAPVPGGATRFDPPPVYARWWGLVEACSGQKGDFHAWTLYRAPASAMRAAGYGSAEGYADVGARRIVIVEGLEPDGSLLRHEMLHALLGPKFASGSSAEQHPPAYFRGRCAGVVWCDQGCLDGGPPPPTASADAPALEPSAVDVGIDVLPARVSRTGADHAVTVVLHATNTSSQPGWLTLEPMPGESPPAAYWWGFRVVPAGQALPLTDPIRVDSTGTVAVLPGGRVSFAAGQTRWLVYDWPAGAYPPGGYELVGIFNTRQIAVPLTITP